MLHSPTGGTSPEKGPRSESGGKRKPLGLSEHAAAGVETQAPLGKATKLPRSEQLRSTSRLPPDARGRHRPSSKGAALEPKWLRLFLLLARGQEQVHAYSTPTGVLVTLKRLKEVRCGPGDAPWYPSFTGTLVTSKPGLIAVHQGPPVFWGLGGCEKVHCELSFGLRCFVKVFIVLPRRFQSCFRHML